MISLKVNLTESVVDIPVNLYAQTRVKINYQKSVGIIDIIDVKPELRSSHDFVVYDAKIIGYNVTDIDATWVLALSCSLSNPMVLFSPQGVTQKEPSLVIERPPPIQTLTSNGKKVSRETIIIPLVYCVANEREIDLYEHQILDLASRLIIFNPFCRQNKNIKELNILEAIQHYRRASTDTDILSCYRSLFASFEKGVTADNPTLKGESFDKAGSAITGCVPKDIEEQRLFYNRIKHAERDSADSKVFSNGENKLGYFILKIKYLADKTILYRLK
jgi:hypothetical protein